MLINWTLTIYVKRPFFISFIDKIKPKIYYIRSPENDPVRKHNRNCCRAFIQA